MDVPTLAISASVTAVVVWLLRGWLDQRARQDQPVAANPPSPPPGPASDDPSGAPELASQLADAKSRENELETKLAELEARRHAAEVQAIVREQNLQSELAIQVETAAANLRAEVELIQMNARHEREALEQSAKADRQMLEQRAQFERQLLEDKARVEAGLARDRHAFEVAQKQAAFEAQLSLRDDELAVLRSTVMELEAEGEAIRSLSKTTIQAWYEARIRRGEADAQEASRGKDRATEDLARAESRLGMLTESPAVVEQHDDPQRRVELAEAELEIATLRAQLDRYTALLTKAEAAVTSARSRLQYVQERSPY